MVRRKKPAGGRRRIAPQKPDVIIRVFEKAGYVLTGKTGSHFVYNHPDKLNNISIPVHQGKDIQKELISALLNTAGISRGEYFRLLDEL